GQGKPVGREGSMGVHRLDCLARVALRVLRPSYRPGHAAGDLLAVFPFRNRVAPGEVDPDVEVYKIDYDFETNPGFIIRRILDELVEVDDGMYLGKILFRTSRGFHPIGFFTLQRPAA